MPEPKTNSRRYLLHFCRSILSLLHILLKSISLLLVCSPRDRLLTRSQSCQKSHQISCISTPHPLGAQGLDRSKQTLPLLKGTSWNSPKGSCKQHLRISYRRAHCSTDLLTVSKPPASSVTLTQTVARTSTLINIRASRRPTGQGSTKQPQAGPPHAAPLGVQQPRWFPYLLFSRRLLPNRLLPKGQSQWACLPFQWVAPQA